MTTLSAKHILVTGGAQGIGRGLVLRCADMGATISVLDVDEGGARDHAAGHACAVGDRGLVAAVAERVLADAGPVDVLVNNAGVVSGRELLDLSDEQIERTFGVNTLALFWTTRAFLPGMLARGSGHVVTVASAAGLIGTPRQTDYAASKHAAVGFAEALRMELGATAPGVKTTLVCPYYIDTGMFAGVTTRFSALLPILQPDEVVERILDAVQRDRELLVLPPVVRVVAPARLLPVWAFDLTARVLGLTKSMDEFRGHGDGPEAARPAAAED
jgi:all-trans-retinol dehydrogenase (NAD+)